MYSRALLINYDLPDSHDSYYDLSFIWFNPFDKLSFFFPGQILIKNWNPLPIPTVTENRTVTVQDILGDLMNVAILKIRISK
jgi:hypothetical protein